MPTQIPPGPYQPGQTQQNKTHRLSWREFASRTRPCADGRWREVLGVMVFPNSRSLLVLLSFVSLMISVGPTAWAGTEGEASVCRDLVPSSVNDSGSADSADPVLSLISGLSTGSSADLGPGLAVLKERYKLPSLEDFAFYAHDDHLYSTILVEQYESYREKFGDDFQQFNEKYFRIISVAERRKMMEGLENATKSYMRSHDTHSKLVRQANASGKLEQSQIEKIQLARKDLDRDYANLKRLHSELVQLSSKDGLHFKVVSIWSHILEERLAQIASLEKQIVAHASNSPDSPEQIKWRSLGAHLLRERADLKTYLETIRTNLRALDISAESMQGLKKAALNALELPQLECLACTQEIQTLNPTTALVVSSRPPLVDRLGLRPFFVKMGWLAAASVAVRAVDIELSPGHFIRAVDDLPVRPREGDSVLIGDASEIRDQWSDRERRGEMPEILTYRTLYRQTLARAGAGNRNIFYTNSRGKIERVKDSDLVVFDLKRTYSPLTQSRFFFRTTLGLRDTSDAGISYIPQGISYDGKTLFLATESKALTSKLLELPVESLPQILARSKEIEKKLAWYAEITRKILGEASSQPVHWSLHDLQRPFVAGSLSGKLSIHENEFRFELGRISDAEASPNYSSELLIWTRPDILWQGFRVGDIVFSHAQPASQASDVSPIYRLQLRAHAEVLGFVRNGKIVVRIYDPANFKRKIDVIEPHELAIYGGLPETGDEQQESRGLSNTLESPAYDSAFAKLADIDFQSDKEFARYQHYYQQTESLPNLTYKQLRAFFDVENTHLLGRKVKMLDYKNVADYDQAKQKKLVPVAVSDEFNAKVTNYVGGSDYVLNDYKVASSKKLFLIEDRTFLFGGLRVGDLLMLGDRTVEGALKEFNVVGFNMVGEVLLKDLRGKYYVEPLSSIRHHLRSPFPEDRRSMFPDEDF